MSQPFSVDILSDSDTECGSGDKRRQNMPEDTIDLITPPSSPQSKKKQRMELITNASGPTVFVIDDEPSPWKKNSSPPVLAKSSSTPSFVAETPLPDASMVKCSRDSVSEQLVVADTPISELQQSKVFIAKCNRGAQLAESLISNHNVAEISGSLFLSSNNEIQNTGESEAWESELHSGSFESSFFVGTSIPLEHKQLGETADEIQMSVCCSISNDLEDVNADSVCSTHKLESPSQILHQQDNVGKHRKDNKKEGKTKKPNSMSKEEKFRLIEEKKQQKEREKLLKAASKAEAAEMKKVKKEMQKWETGKYAIKSIVAEIDKKVVELGSIAGHLLTRFAEKGLSYRISSNPIERTIIWSMVVPEELSAISSEGIEISYVLIIYEAEEFCNLLLDQSLEDHVKIVQKHYPHHTICYATNRLIAHINKREQAQYKNPANYGGWKRPAVEEVLAKLSTHYLRVHSRLCVDEAELAEHVVGLTCSLATCQFRKKITRLSVNANGSVIPKDCIDKNLIKKNLWLKALLAIPKVQPRFALAIGKKYPTMKSLLSVYMDPSTSVHEKEFLLKDLTTEGLLGDDRRLGEVCSKRIYRILMAQSGKIKTHDVENGADFFARQPI